MLNELRELIERLGTLPEGSEDPDVLYAERDAHLRLVSAIRELLAEPTNVQALALARLIRDFEANGAMLSTHPFDLPEGYWSASIRAEHGPDYACGIAPDGSVSS